MADSRAAYEAAQRPAFGEQPATGHTSRPPQAGQLAARHGRPGAERPYVQPPGEARPRDAEAKGCPAHPGAGEIRPCQGAQILARVGQDVILACEVMPALREIMAKVPRSKLAQIPPERLEMERKGLLRQLLERRIELKLVYQDVCRAIPAENLKKIEENLAQQFEKTEVPRRIKQAGVGSRAELDERLRQVGTSLARQKRAFIERVLAQQWIHQQGNLDEQISHEEMLDYYYQHLADYQQPARALWEKLTVRIPRYSDGRSAYAALARMGNQLMRGTPIADVLQAHAGGSLDCRGGLQGWVTRGSLEVSRTMEEVIFGLPVGRLSQIFRDGDGFHIVRVLKRQEATRTPFEEAQVEIRKKLRQLHRQKRIETYLARLKREIPVWTVFDDEPALAQLPQEGHLPRR